MKFVVTERKQKHQLNCHEEIQRAMNEILNAYCKTSTTHSHSSITPSLYKAIQTILTHQHLFLFQTTMETPRRTQSTCLLIWGLVAALLSHIAFSTSSNLQDQKNFYFPPFDPSFGLSPPVAVTPPIVPSPPISKYSRLL